MKACFILPGRWRITAIDFATFFDQQWRTVEVGSFWGNLFLNAAPEEGGKINVGFSSTSFLYLTIYYAESTGLTLISSLPLYRLVQTGRLVKQLYT